MGREVLLPSDRPTSAVIAEGAGGPGSGPLLRAALRSPAHAQSLESPGFPRVTGLLLDGTRFESPLKSVNFLEAYPAVLRRKFEAASLQDCLDSAGNRAPSAFIRHLPGLGTATHKHATGLVREAGGLRGRGPVRGAGWDRLLRRWPCSQGPGGEHGQAAGDPRDRRPSGGGTVRWLWAKRGQSVRAAAVHGDDSG